MKDEMCMPISESVTLHENVNGVQLCLVVDKKSEVPKSRIFTISYTNEKSRRPWLKKYLLIAMCINFFALGYLKVNLTAVAAIFVSFISLTIFWMTHTVQSETALVIPSVGIQSSVNYVFGRKDDFIPWSRVDDVIINEVIKMSRVLYQLTVLVKPWNKSDTNIELVPLFKYTKPRLSMLEKIYGELQILLLESQRQDLTMGSGDQDFQAI